MVSMGYSAFRACESQDQRPKRWLSIIGYVELTVTAAETLLELSCNKFQEAVIIKNEYDILYNYGNALLWLARLKIDAKNDVAIAINLLDQSCTFFEQAAALR
jgi:hypothetical protein